MQENSPFQTTETEPLSPSPNF